MKNIGRRLSSLATSLYLLLAASLGTLAQAQVAEVQSVAYSQEELDQLLAPVALYPDSLLAQVLTASTYPLEVVSAARFIDRNRGLKGNSLAKAVEPYGWDASVTSLVQFPSVLAMMSDKLEWTQQLGDAFLDQPEVVMDTAQSLRAKAQAAGNLQSNDQQRVIVEERYIVIEPARPQVVFVPYYNPVVVYGNWWWPARPPWYWVPPPIYRPVGWSQVVATGVVWSVAIGITQSIWFDARPSWRDRHLTIINVNVGRPGYRPGVWAHNPVHRQGVSYRDVQTRDRFRPVDKAAVALREPYRGRDKSVKLPPRSSPGMPPATNLAPRPVTRPATRPGLTPSPAARPAPTLQPRPTLRPTPRPMPEARPAPRPMVLKPGLSRDTVRQQSDRGRESRQARPSREVSRQR